MEAESVRYIAVEGVIGVGKTTLARRFAALLGAYPLLEEVEENPFLAHFYKDRRAHAFQTQIFFLLSRYRQQRALLQRDLFRDVVVSDYMFDKDRIFAHINLDDHELEMYNQIFALMERDLARPDRVVYLQASPEVLLSRVTKRGRVFERDMDPAYLETLAEAYAYFFTHYRGSPVLIVNAAETDFVADPGAAEELLAAALRLHEGSAFFRAGAEGQGVSP
ncbi:MAG: deoxynucleoside kinase [Candidatus Eisenbacteria bacterium]|uniref:Deoxynucleoside kinase n=1 Tax=Eiseniibacteriota bacterium TaxID=2212470 RepID=A0A937XA59_UNCEI|nr:deoxynucleoside kinase [Candidatus Eisenbacteria bacterium]